jgi:hypothetical protein
VDVLNWCNSFGSRDSLPGVQNCRCRWYGRSRDSRLKNLFANLHG